MRLFYMSWPITQTVSAHLGPTIVCLKPAKAQTLSAQLSAPQFLLPWSAYVSLLSVKNEQARKFLRDRSAARRWSVRQLDRQINSLFYERTALSSWRNAPAAAQRFGLVKLSRLFVLN